MENTISAPFAARDYSSKTHIKKVTDVPSESIMVTLRNAICNAVSGYVEPLGNGLTRVTIIEKK